MTTTTPQQPASAGATRSTTPTDQTATTAIERPETFKVDVEELPEFATVMRGYDRGQVDDYVTRLHEFIYDAEQRAGNAERRIAQSARRIEDLERELSRALERSSAPSAVYEGLGERVGAILRLASEEAESVREAARDEANEIKDAARREKEGQITAAERELTEIGRRRDGVVAELARVRDVLSALGLSAGQPEEKQPPQTSNRQSGSKSGQVVDLRDHAART